MSDLSPITSGDSRNNSEYFILPDDMEFADVLMPEKKRPRFITISLDDSNQLLRQRVQSFVATHNLSPSVAAYALQKMTEPWKQAGEVPVPPALRDSRAEVAVYDSLMSRGDMCPLCWDEEQDTMGVRFLPCRHTFHKGCVKSYLQNALMTKSTDALVSTCPMSGCSVPMHMDIWNAIFGEYSCEMRKFQQFQTQNFIEMCPFLRWCPTCPSSALSVIELTDESVMQNVDISLVAKCFKCSSEFCFTCGMDPHAPATCKQMREWQKKETDDSETANWITAHTKNCAHCGVRIEKNEGCNQITCQRCHKQMCWVCEDKWNGGEVEHSDHFNCPKKLKPKVDSKSNARKKAQVELEKYIHYYQRYKFHKDARVVNLKLLEKPGVKELDHLTNAVHTLAASRLALEYTYVYGFFLCDSSSQNSLQMFEIRQESLEKQAEKLAHMIMKCDNVMKLEKFDVVSQARTTEEMLEILRKGF